MIEYEAELLKGRRYIVRPRGALGTCGFYPEPWEAVFTTAANPAAALKRARNIRAKRRKARRATGKEI